MHGCVLSWALMMMLSNSPFVSRIASMERCVCFVVAVALSFNICFLRFDLDIGKCECVMCVEFTLLFRVQTNKNRSR